MAQILVVDDSGYARKVLRKSLEQANHTIVEANGGMAAIESYYLSRPELVLLDLTMEDLDGMEVLRKLREIDQAAKVIVVSADVQATTVRMVEAAGAISFLPKPVDPKELLSAIDEALKQASK